MVSDETPPETPDAEAEQLRSSALIPAANAPPLPAASPTPPPVKTSTKPATVTRPPTSPEFAPRPQPPRAAQTVAPRPPSSNDVLRGTEAAAPVLTKELQEQLFGVIRASLDATLGPLHDKVRELEARVDVLRAQPIRSETLARPPTVPPLVPSAPKAPGGPMQPSLSVDVTPDMVRSVPPPASIKPSITSTSYGLVIDGGSRQPPPMQQALANVGPIDVPDFGGSRRRVGRILVGLLLAVVVAAIIATILSYN